MKGVRLYTVVSAGKPVAVYGYLSQACLSAIYNRPSKVIDYAGRTVYAVNSPKGRTRG